MRLGQQMRRKDFGKGVSCSASEPVSYFHFQGLSGILSCASDVQRYKGPSDTALR